MKFHLAAKHLPRPADPALAEAGLQQWHEAAAAAGDAGIARFVREWATDPPRQALLAAVFGNSPFLSLLLRRDLAFSRLLLGDGPDAAYAAAPRFAASSIP